MKNAMDKLIDKIKEMDNPTVMGLDPRYDMIPSCIANKYQKTIENRNGINRLVQINIVPKT